MRVRKKSVKNPIVQKLKNYRSKYEIETDDDWPRMPFSCCFVGTKGSGKTYSCIQFVRECEDRGYITRTFLLSPTVESNSVYNNLRTLDRENNVCGDQELFQHALDDVIEKIKEAREEREKEIAYAKLYKKSISGEELSLVEENILKMNDYRKPQIPKEIRPLLLCDDVQGTAAFTSGRRDRMAHITIKHRHLGLSIINLVQTLQGVPRVVRLNSNIFILFKTSDLKQLDEIASLFGAFISKQDFLSLFRYATNEEHGFFFVDLCAKNKSLMFRKGFNELLEVEDHK